MNFSTTALAVTKIDDISVGTIFSEGIQLHGFFNTAPVPLPPGEWKVLSREESITNVVSLLLVGQQDKPTIPFMKITVNLDVERGGIKFVECSTQTTLGEISNNNFDSKSSQFVYRCAKTIMRTSVQNFLPFLAKRLPDWKIFDENKDRFNGAMNLVEVHFDTHNGICTALFFGGSMSV